jgi:alkylation response protein AidB-like acyl-CoA dehydrogenase
MSKIDLSSILAEIGPRCAEGSADAESNDAFVAENYARLKQMRVFSAQVPEEFGGGGATHKQMCAFLRGLAGHCPSTALALSMHQHLVAAAKKNHLDGKPGKALLEKVGAGELVLVSTGANDWLESNGSAKRVEGGYRVNAVKPFGSGSPMGDVAVTSCAFDDPEAGPSVIHFPIPLKSEGVSLLDDWQTLGMRATGSQSLKFEDVFVPEAAVALKRPRGEYHGAFSVIVTCAMPLIMSVYVGVAESAAELARAHARKRVGDPAAPMLIGEMENLLVVAQMAVDSMAALADDLAFTPSEALASQILSRKTVCANHVIATTHKALEAMGGAGFFRRAGVERLLRDALASQFHPLPEKRQQMFTGRVSMGLSPVEARTF